MAFSIVEQFCQGKLDNGTNEDRLFFNGKFACVVDGVSSLGRTSTIGKETAGQWAARVVCESLAGCPQTANKNEVIKELSYSFRIALKEELEVSQTLMGPMATAAIVSLYWRQVWLIGDCQCLLVKESNHAEYHRQSIVWEEHAVKVRRHVLRQLSGSDLPTSVRAQRCGEDMGRQAILPLLAMQRRFANQDEMPYGYSVINGQDIPTSLVPTVEMAPDTGKVVLATDGYPKLFPTLAESEAYLEWVLREDPAMIHLHPATKGRQPGFSSFDDRAYLSLKL